MAKRSEQKKKSPTNYSEPNTVKTACEATKVTPKDLFAAAALAGLLANGNFGFDDGEVASRARRYADAMFRDGA